MRPKISYLGIFELKLENNIVMFEISTLKFLISESLTNTVNFGIGSAFSEGPGSNPGPLYKVCQRKPLDYKDIVNFIFMTSQPAKETTFIYILPNISQSKSNQTVKLGQ